VTAKPVFSLSVDLLPLGNGRHVYLQLSKPAQVYLLVVLVTEALLSTARIKPHRSRHGLPRAQDLPVISVAAHGLSNFTRLQRRSASTTIPFKVRQLFESIPDKTSPSLAAPLGRYHRYPRDRLDVPDKPRWTQHRTPSTFSLLYAHAPASLPFCPVLFPFTSPFSTTLSLFPFPISTWRLKHRPYTPCFQAFSRLSSLTARF